jgi:electron transport complex protein RnfG
MSRNPVLKWPALVLDREGIGYQMLLLGGFALAASALLVVGHLLTKGPIAEREAEDLRASLAQVIPEALHDNDLLANPLPLRGQGSGRQGDDAITVYRALQGLDVTAVAFESVGQGYAGPIRVLLGIGADGRILGARVLAHSETPGLGDKIEIARDDWITGFDGLSLAEPPPERWAVKKDGGVFDQFSGATITPRAVVAAIKGGLETFAAQRDSLTASAVIRTEAR